MHWLNLRIPPLLLTLGFAAAIWAAAPWLPTVMFDSPLPSLLAGFMAVAAIIFCLLGIVEFRRHQTTVDPRTPSKATQLVDGGIYGISRNPMYVGFALLLLAQVIWLATPWLLLAVIGFVLYMNHFQIIPEEAALQASFGSRYSDYCTRVRRWL